VANKLNMTIAKTHALSGRLIGMQLTSGTLLGVILSCVQMMAGFVVLAGLVGIPVGLILAVMVEKLSLGGLASVRVAGEQLKQLEGWFYAKELSTEREQTLFAQRKKQLGRQRLSGWVLGGGGMLLSAVIGDTFWSWLYRDMHPLWLGTALSLCCAAVVGLNFVHGELFKPLIDMVLKTILVDHEIERTAVVAAEQDMQINMMIDAYTELQNDEDVKGPVMGKIKGAIGKRWGDFARQVNVSAERVDALGVNIVEGSLLGPGQQLALPAPRGKYHQHRDELCRLLRANPQLSDGDVAKHFAISRSTANSWVNRVRSGQ
jgi:hypothetical protein